ncbi:MAG: hypothetical protein JWO68_434 [Actinomycetia bacterium]|nr:hypothetical protein [Actinomycetes bacterium]
MGLGRPHHLVVGLVVVVGVLWNPMAASSRPARPRVVHGEVGPGVAVAHDGWRVTHPSAGVYRIHLARSEVELDVPSWDAVADVIITPMGHGTNEVRFSYGGEPLDTPFTFVAVAVH